MILKRFITLICFYLTLSLQSTFAELLNHTEFLSKEDILMHNEMMQQKEYQDGMFIAKLATPNDKKLINIIFPTSMYKVFSWDKRLEKIEYGGLENNEDYHIETREKFNKQNLLLLISLRSKQELLNFGIAQEKGVEDKLLPISQFHILLDELGYTKAMAKGFNYELDDALPFGMKLEKISKFSKKSFEDYWQKEKLNSYSAKYFGRTDRCIYMAFLMKRTIYQSPLKIPFVNGLCVINGIPIVLYSVKYFNNYTLGITAKIFQMTKELDTYEKLITIN